MRRSSIAQEGEGVPSDEEHVELALCSLQNGDDIIKNRRASVLFGEGSRRRCLLGRRACPPGVKPEGRGRRCVTSASDPTTVLILPLRLHLYSFTMGVYITALCTSFRIRLKRSLPQIASSENLS